jgi:hypothetical protein
MSIISICQNPPFFNLLLNKGIRKQPTPQGGLKTFLCLFLFESSIQFNITIKRLRMAAKLTQRRQGKRSNPAGF